MKTLSFLKFGLLIPMIGVVLSSCKSTENPYLQADMYAWVVQKEVSNVPGTFTYSPDIRVYAVSSSGINKGFFKKDGSTLNSDSPFWGGYEVLSNAYSVSSPAELNGIYTFEATNDEGETLLKNFQWDFVPAGGVSGVHNKPFTESWGESADPTDRQSATHYSKFEYDGRVVRAVIKPFANEQTSIRYAIMFGRYIETGAGASSPESNPETEPSAWRLSLISGDISNYTETPSTGSTADIPITYTIPNDLDINDFAQVALVALKPVTGPDGAAGTVMMRTEYKTIRKGQNWFTEDGNPE